MRLTTRKWYADHYHRFYEQLDSLVARHPKEADIGGVPTTMNKVRAYIRILAARKELNPDGIELQILEGDYCWAFIFFLLRSGLIKEAADYVTSHATAFKALDRNFITYITSYASSPDRRLSRPIQDRINAEYQQRTRIAPENSLDPYRMACYKVIGRCELTRMKIESVSQGMEDWIWLQFAMTREVNRVEESAGEVHGLEEVRETIREIEAATSPKARKGWAGTAHTSTCRFWEACSNRQCHICTPTQLLLRSTSPLHWIFMGCYECPTSLYQRPSYVSLGMIRECNILLTFDSDLQYEGNATDQLWSYAWLLYPGLPSL